MSDVDAQPWTPSAKKLALTASAKARVAEKGAELQDRVSAGEITIPEAIAEMEAFAELTRRHLNEHGPDRPDSKPRPPAKKNSAVLASNARERLVKKNEELLARVAAGEITSAEARAELREFGMLIIAHRPKGA